MFGKVLRRRGGNRGKSWREVGWVEIWDPEKIWQLGEENTWKEDGGEEEAEVPRCSTPLLAPLGGGCCDAGEWGAMASA